MPEISLRLDGYDLVGWQSVQVQRSLDQLADSFDLAMISPLSSSPPPTGVVREGDAVEIRYDDELVLSGYIDEVSESSTATSFSLAVSGRSKAKDLVDCSALHKGAWRNMRIDQIATDIAVPFGLRVSTDLPLADLPTERSFQLEAGESAFEAIDRLVRDYGLRVVSYPDGELLLTRTGLLRFPDVVIERGINIIEGGVRRSENERFSQYIFRADLAADDESWGENRAISFAVADDGVSRYRPLVVHRDGQKRNATGQKARKELEVAANWERNTRAGKSLQLSYRVLFPGDVTRSWEMGEHGVWTPNVIVGVIDDHHAVDGSFLVTSVSLRRSNAGTEAQLELTHPEAYLPEKPPHKKSKKKGFSW